MSTPHPSDQMPTYDQLLWPMLCALESLGGSASIAELDEQVAQTMKLNEEVLDVVHGNGPQTEFAYRCGWGRTYLKKIGAIDNTDKGFWAILDSGRKIESESDTLERLANVRKQISIERKKREKEQPEGEIEPESDMDWRNLLLEKLRSIDPSSFERLCQRILRENGFVSVEVTGKSGDGGIDGSGVLRINLISFHVLFQCKRYTGGIQVSQVRDFRGAMDGRADKGLFITTGHFTEGAKREATRDGATPIDLVDGYQLCELLKQSKLGVRIETKEEITPNLEFFDDF